MFAIIKVINHKLHILFDGEELLEEDKNESGDGEEPAKEEPISPSSISIQHDQVTEDTDSLKNKENGDEKNADTTLKTDNSSMVSLMSISEMSKIINSALSEPSSQEQTDTQQKDSLSKLNGDNVDRKEKATTSQEQSNTELVTSSPTRSSAERAIVVDLHSTKVVFNEKETKHKG